TIEEAFAMGRHDANDILKEVYADFDYAITNLPEEYSGSSVSRVNKGAAIAMKARVALWMSDWEVERDETKKLIELNLYSLYPDYQAFFESNKIESDTIFSLPRSRDLTVVWSTKNFMPSTVGG